MSDAWIILPFIAFFAWKFYKHRKAILHNMKLYGEYMANYLRYKADEKQRKNRRRER